MKRLSQGIDQWGNPIVAGIEQADAINAIVFTAAGTAVDNVPEGASFVLIQASHNADIFVKIGGAAAVPTGSVSDGSASEVNPLMRMLNGAATIGVAASAACIVTLSYYG